jgi:hypothetical protein
MDDEEREALTDSLLGVFLVAEHRTGEYVITDLEDDQTHDLDEIEGVALDAGDLLIGRLYAGSLDTYIASPALARQRDGRPLAVAFRRDVDALGIDRRLTQAELEHLLFRGRGALRAPGRVATALPRVPLEHLEADLERVLMQGGVDPEELSATAISEAMQGIPRPGAVLAPLMEQIAFDTDVDLEAAQRLMVSIWQHHHDTATAEGGGAGPADALSSLAADVDEARELPRARAGTHENPADADPGPVSDDPSASSAATRTGPATPTKPTAPAKPTTPAKPTAPAKPTTPATPTGPATPTAPSTPTTPATPTAPSPTADDDVVPGLGAEISARIARGLAEQEELDRVFGDVEAMVGEPVDADIDDIDGDALAAFGNLPPLITGYLWETGGERGPDAAVLEQLVAVKGQAALPRRDVESLAGDDLIRVLLQVYLENRPGSRSAGVGAAFATLQRFLTWVEDTQEIPTTDLLTTVEHQLVQHVARLDVAGMHLSTADSTAQQGGRVHRVIACRALAIEVALGGDHRPVLVPVIAAVSGNLRIDDLLLGALLIDADGQGSFVGMVVAMPGVAADLLG